MGDLISPDDFSRYSNADLCIRTFGGFSISKNGEIVQLERTNRTKTMHALQMLICAGESGVTSELMMESLFSDENVANPANNLKVTISHLRKTLRESGLDGCFKIQYRSGGYYLDFLKPVSIDFQEFYNCMHEPSSNREERLKYLLRAESIYTGDFLPHLEDYTWVITLSTKFRESYFNCIEEIAAILTAKEEWSQLLPIAGRAAARYHLEEWHCICIDCLIKLGQINTAWEAYRRAIRSLKEDMDVSSLSPRMRARYHRLEELRRMEKENQGLGGLHHNEEDKSPYFCPYTSFVDLYRISSRVMPYRTTASYLLVYSFSDSFGKHVKERNTLKKSGHAMNMAITSCLRSSDVYTRYSGEMYLVLLIDISHKEALEIDGKIRRLYRNAYTQRACLRGTLTKVGEEITAIISGHQWTDRSVAKEES